MLSRRHLLQLAGLTLPGLAVGCAGPSTSRPGRVGPAADAFLDDLQERTFRFFWETTNAENGLAPDRYPTPSFCSMAAVGFALTAYPIGVRRGYVTRAQAAERTLTTLRFLARAPQGDAPVGMTGHRGFFYHFVDMRTGARFEKTELSTVDTALLLGGALLAQSFFDRPEEAEIRELVEFIYRRVEWPWSQVRAPAITLGWHPETGHLPYDWIAYSESMLVYIMALGSPTHAVGADAWVKWSEGLPRHWGVKDGQEHVRFGPLFGHQYSHIWIDFRDIQDDFMRGKGIDYFENSRRATLAQYDYALRNPQRWRGYGERLWGLTACDGPADVTVPVDGVPRAFRSYSARGPGEFDDGTVAPTAAGGSVAFAPELCIPVLMAMRADHGEHLYKRYGFLDSLNLTIPPTVTPLRHGTHVPGRGWYADDYLGIDQGPILAMIENYRSGFIWDVLRSNPHIRRGLERAGFSGGWLRR